MKKEEIVMPKHPIFKIIVAKQFFNNYCPEVKNVKHKLRGIDGNYMPIDFTPEDKKMIKAAVQQLSKDLKTMVPK